MGKFSKQAIYAAAVAAFLAIGAFFMANVPMPPWASYASAVNVVLFALPAFLAVRWWLGWRDGSIFIAVLGAYALAIETAAIITGFPYGHFGYSEYLGYRLFGYAPWTVAFAWSPLIIGAYAAAANMVSSAIGRVVLCTLLLTAFDFVLDPGAVYLGFWQYDGGGWYYGVPMSNFGGWLVSGSIGAILIELMLAKFKPLLPTPMQLAVSALFIVWFWTAFALFAAMWLPFVIGLLLVAFLLVIYRQKHFAFDDIIVMVNEANEPYATERKHVAHHAATKLHRAFSIFLFNSRGELMLQQRALSKQTWPGTWSNSCCGHVMLHESVANAAVRRLRFELGISGVELTNALPEFRYIAEKDGIVENEICPVFVGFTDKHPKPNRDEVESTKNVAWQEFLADISRPDTEMSPWAIEEARLLADDTEFKRLYETNLRRDQR